MIISEFISLFDKIFPRFMAESWDKVGLLVCPNKNSHLQNVLVVNDLTLAAVESAKQKKTEMILCYHPLIFSPLSTISQFGSWQEKVVIECIKNSISVYSVHTILDNINNGVNDFLLKPLDCSRISPIKDNSSLITKNYPYSLKLADGSKFTPDSISNLINSDVFIPLNENFKIDYIFFKSLIVRNYVKASFPKSSEIENPLQFFCGSGRIGFLNNPIEFKSFNDIVKSNLNLSNLRSASPDCSGIKNKIHSVAVCAGSGGSILKDVDSDVLLTGEMMHHDILKAVQDNKHVILLEHTPSENPFIRQFAENLNSLFLALNIDVTVHCGPLLAPVETL